MDRKNRPQESNPNKNRYQPRIEVTENSSTKKQVEQPKPKEITVHIPQGWARLIPAALIATVFPLLVIMALVVVGYFSSAGNPWLVESSWTDSLAVGIAVWVLGYGVPIRATLEVPFVISVIPLGLVWFNIYWSVFLIRRFCGIYRITAWFFIPLQMLFVFVIGVSNKGPYKLWQLVLASGIFALLSVVLALYRDQKQQAKIIREKENKTPKTSPIKTWITAKKTLLTDFWNRLCHPDQAYYEDQEKLERGEDRDAIIIDGVKNTWIIPGWVVSGLRTGTRIFKFLALVTIVLVLIQLVVQHKQIIAINQLLHINITGMIVLWASQIAYLPTIQCWALAWIAGPGFSQGTGTLHTLWQNQNGPYPAIPILSLIPHYHPGNWPIVVGVIVAGVFGYLVYIYQARQDIFYHIATVLTGVLTLAVLVSATQALASGGIGPGRMQHWGGDPLLVTAVVLAEWSGPMVAVMLFAHPKIRQWLYTHIWTQLVLGGQKLKEQGQTVWTQLEATKAAASSAKKTAENEPENEPENDQQTVAIETVTASIKTASEAPEKETETAREENEADSAEHISNDEEAVSGEETPETAAAKTNSPLTGSATHDQDPNSSGEKRTENPGGEDETNPVGVSSLEEKETSNLEPIIPPVGKKTKLADLGARAFAQSRGGDTAEWEEEEIREVAEKWVKRKARQREQKPAPPAVPKPDLNDPRIPKYPVKRSVFRRSQVQIKVSAGQNLDLPTGALPTADTMGVEEVPPVEKYSPTENPSAVKPEN